MKEAIEIKTNGDKLVWRVNAEIKTNTEVLAHEGVQCIVVHDGGVLMQIWPGKRSRINEKAWYERKNRGEYELYGVNTGKTVTLKWGTRTSPQYKDSGYDNATLQVRCYGQSNAKVENPSELFKLMLSEGEALTEEGLKEKIADTMSAVCTETVAGIANELREKAQIEAAGRQVGERMTARFKKSFYEQYGLCVEESVVLGIKVTGDEEFTKKQNDLVAAKLDTALSEQNKNQAMHAVDVLKGLEEATGQKNKAAKEPRAGEPAKQERKEPAKRKFCVDCGKELPLDAKFCSDCGRRQA